MVCKTHFAQRGVDAATYLSFTFCAEMYLFPEQQRNFDTKFLKITHQQRLRRYHS